MGQIFGKDAKPLITFSCINVRDADNINITRVDGKEKREEKKKEEQEEIKKIFCFRKKRGKNSFEERRDRKTCKSVRRKKEKKNRKIYRMILKYRKKEIHIINE